MPSSGLLVIGLVGLGYVAYRLYKMFRGPVYMPGVVAKSAKPKGFDDEALQDKSTSTSWQMPDGIEIYHFPVATKAKVPVLGLHGGPGIAPKTPWALQREIPGFYLYHARGCGLSTRPFSKFPTPGIWPGMKILEETLGLGAQIGDIERIRTRLRAERLNIVAHSFGAFVATLYAAEFPDRVASLVLLAPASCLVLPAPKGSFDLFETIRTKLKGNRNEKDIAEYEDFMKRYFDFSKLPKSTEQSLAELQQEFSKHFFRAAGTEQVAVSKEQIGGMAIYASYFSMGMEHDYTEDLKKLLAASEFPVRIFHGEEDMFPSSESHKYVALFPKANVRFEVVKGGHFLQDDPHISESVRNLLST